MEGINYNTGKHSDKTTSYN